MDERINHVPNEKRRKGDFRRRKSPFVFSVSGPVRGRFFPIRFGDFFGAFSRFFFSSFLVRLPPFAAPVPIFPVFRTGLGRRGTEAAFNPPGKIPDPLLLQTPLVQVPFSPWP